MATLNLVKTDEGKYFLQGTGDASQNADFSLFDWDGEGGDPFQFGSQKWEIVPLQGLSKIVYHCSECGEEIEADGFCEEHPSATVDSVMRNGVEYDAEDTDTFWTAQAQIVEAAEKAGIEVPSYAKGE